jgi:hypothetical protein
VTETRFIGLYRGHSIGDARLIAVSSDRQIVNRFFAELVGEGDPDEAPERPALEVVRGDED